MKKVLFYHFFKILLVGLAVIGTGCFSGSIWAQSGDMRTDFEPLPLYIATGGTTLDIDTDIFGSFFVENEHIYLSVIFEMVDNAGNVVHAETLWPEKVTRNWFGRTLGIGQTSFPFTLPNDPTIANQVYWVNIYANYTYIVTPNFPTYTLYTDLNGAQIDSDNTLTGVTNHYINHAFQINYSYDPCFDLAASISKNVNKFQRLTATAQGSGGSGNYSYHWVVDPTHTSSSYTTTNSSINVNCGCVDVTLTITDNITGCQEVHQERLCSPIACSIRPSTRFRAGINGAGPVFEVVPNPASHFVTVSIDENVENAQVSISDISGKEVLRQLLTSSEERIDVSGMNPGVYLVVLKQGDLVSKHQKIVIQR